MTTSRLRLIGLVSSALAAAALACNGLTPGATPTVPSTATPTALPVVATTTAVPTEVPPTEAPPTDVPPTEGPALALRLVVGKDDGTAFLVDPQGQISPITEMQEPLYLFTHALSADFSQPARAYNISSAGVFPLDVVQNVFQGFAAYVGPAAPNGLFAWDSYTVDDSGQVVGQLHVSSPDGSDQRVAYEETSQMTALRVWRWATDGQTLYFSKEPLGLGGYIPYWGVTNVWALSLADGSVREVAAGGGFGCVDDLSPDETLLADHCAPGFVTVQALGQGPVAAVAVPPEAESLLVGDAHLSPDNSRVAFAFALGVPDAEQGWAAVSDGLGSTAHLIAKADAGELFHVVQWLDADTVLLQSSGANPGVYRAAADGSAAPQRLADGTLLGVIDNVAGQP